MMSTTLERSLPRLASVDDIVAYSEGKLGRSATYDHVKRTGELLGVRPVRVGRKLLFPGEAIERALAGESPAQRSGEG